jgi:predicted DNA repair protein MutK
MATSLIALIDDVATLLDDVAVLTKLATKKTAGVLGDDLALNAEQLTGISAARELPVVWSVAKGSAVNKAILVPAALAISAIAPWAVTPLLMLGGLFLCFEGVEKLAHRLLHSEEEDALHGRELAAALVRSEADLLAFERDKIKGAIRTDFILSAEIIVIALGTVATAPFATRVGVLLGVATIMTVGVYGFVAAIVKLDDAGLYLSRRETGGAAAGLRALGGVLLRTAPLLMKLLSIAGTAAMFLVGGGILVHGIDVLHHAIEGAAHEAEALPAVGAVAGALTSAIGNAVVGVVAGALVLGGVTLVRRLRSK